MTPACTEAGGLTTGVVVFAGIESRKYRVRGTVSRLGIKGPYRLYLTERLYGRFVATTVSDENGNYSFDYVPNVGSSRASYTIIAVDHTGDPLNAAISDYVTPEPM